jgi:hypothetical protein
MEWLVPAIRGLIFSGECREQIRVELKVAKNHLLSTRLITQERHLKVNIGSGQTPLEGWINIDAFPISPSVIAWDCRRSIPLPDGSAAFIFAEHFFEHIERPSRLIFAQVLRTRLGRACGNLLRLLAPAAATCGAWDATRNQDGIYQSRFPPVRLPSVRVRCRNTNPYSIDRRL